MRKKFSPPQSIVFNFEPFLSHKGIQYIKVFASGGARGACARPLTPADLARALRALVGAALRLKEAPSTYQPRAPSPLNPALVFQNKINILTTCTYVNAIINY